jgi:hypothetical protein
MAYMAIKLYCEEVPQEGDISLAKLQIFMEKVMEQMRKEHYSTFCKHFTICDRAFGPKFLQEI